MIRKHEAFRFPGLTCLEGMPACNRRFQNGAGTFFLFFTSTLFDVFCNGLVPTISLSRVRSETRATARHTRSVTACRAQKSSRRYFRFRSDYRDRPPVLVDERNPRREEALTATWTSFCRCCLHQSHAGGSRLANLLPDGILCMIIEASQGMPRSTQDPQESNRVQLMMENGHQWDAVALHLPHLPAWFILLPRCPSAYRRLTHE